MAGRCVRSGGAADTVAFTFDRAGQRPRNTVSCPDANPGARPFIGRLAIRQDPVRRLGRTLYLFTADVGAVPRCYNACATAWPPFVLTHPPTAGPGLEQSKIATATRTDGAIQVTYNGHPLYYYAGDHAPGEIKCQAVVEFGGGWYVVDGQGNQITRP